MKHYIRIPTLALLFCATFALHSDGFGELQEAIDRKKGWVSKRTENSVIFQNARKKLGASFKANLLEFIAESPDAHFNCAMFLLLDGYLHESEPNPELALMILHQGIALTTLLPEEEREKEQLRFHVMSTLAAIRAGYARLAAYHKSRAQELKEKYPYHIPALGEADSEEYDFIPLAPFTEAAENPEKPDTESPEI